MYCMCRRVCFVYGYTGDCVGAGRMGTPWRLYRMGGDHCEERCSLVQVVMQSVLVHAVSCLLFPSVMGGQPLRHQPPCYPRPLCLQTMGG
jgi:hypothetical protein